MNNTGGYIDIHTHILPGVDDGARSMEETLWMLRQASEQGIETIIATPHYAVGAKNASVEHLKEIREQVQTEASKINPRLQIKLGNELYYSDSVLESLKAKEALTLADSRYVLVEFSTGAAYNSMYQGLGSLIRSGYIPIVAHIERYHCLEKKEYRIADLIELGCYIQMNCNSLQGGFFDSEAKYNRKLVNQGMVHFLGSDCHDSKNRVPSMKSAIEILKKRCDEGLLNNICYKNPVSVLENIYI